MDTNLSSKMSLFSQMITCGQSLSYWELDPSLQVISSSCQNADLFHAFFMMDDCSAVLQEQLQEERPRPILYFNSIGMSWIVTAEVVEGSLCRFHTIGPAFTSDVSYLNLENSLSRRKYPAEMIRQFIDHIRDVPMISLDRWMSYGLMLHFCVTQEKLDISDLKHIDLAVPMSGIQTNDEVPYPKDRTWLAEQLITKMVEEGQVDNKKARADLSRIGRAEIKFSSSSLRQLKNYVIGFNSMVVRAALRGGLDPTTAYHLGGVYLESIEAATSISSLMQLCNTMLEDFTQRVHKVRTASGVSQAVLSCCSYIDMHLGEKLNMQTLALQVGYAEYYLAQKFKKEMGMSVSQYIRQRRIEQAEIMLKSSNQSVASIADALGFCNSSHFSDAFRSLTGVTPAEYRDSPK